MKRRDCTGATVSYPARSSSLVLVQNYWIQFFLTCFKIANRVEARLFKTFRYRKEIPRRVKQGMVQASRICSWIRRISLSSCSISVKSDILSVIEIKNEYQSLFCYNKYIFLQVKQFTCFNNIQYHFICQKSVDKCFFDVVHAITSTLFSASLRSRIVCLGVSSMIASLQHSKSTGVSFFSRASSLPKTLVRLRFQILSHTIKVQISLCYKNNDITK